MKNALCLFCLLFALWFAPSRAEEEEAPPPPEWQLYYDCCAFREACCGLSAFEGLEGFELFREEVRRCLEADAAAFRRRQSALAFEGREELLSSEVERLLAEGEAVLRGECRWEKDDIERWFVIGWVQQRMPRDAEGEAWLSVRQVQRRLGEVRTRLFAALAEVEQNLGWEAEQQRAALRAFLPHLAAYRRELMCWGRRTLGDERLRRWEQEDLLALDLESMAPGRLVDCFEYWRADAEEAESQFQLLWRRACRREAARLKAGRFHPLPEDPAWLAGEPAGQGLPAGQEALFRLRDYLALYELLSPEDEHVRSGVRADAAPADPQQAARLRGRALAQLVQAAEREMLLPRLEPLGLGNMLWGSVSMGGYFPWYSSLSSRELVDSLRLRAGLDFVRLAAPAASAEEGCRRAESELARMRFLLDEAEKLLPLLPERPDTACRSLLSRLAAQWTACTYSLRRWGRQGGQSFLAWRGCEDRLVIWNEAYELPGIGCNGFGRVDGEVVVDGIRPFFSTLLAEMREVLDIMQQDHFHPRPPFDAEVDPSHMNLLPDSLDATREPAP